MMQLSNIKLAPTRNGEAYYWKYPASCVYILVLLYHLLAPEIMVIVKDNTVYFYNLNPISNRITIRERLKQSLALFPYIYVCNFAGQT
jgi:hypothetical protein